MNLRTIIFICLVIFTIYITYRALRHYSDCLYIQIDNDNDIDTARAYLRYRRFIPNTALDNYRMGNIFDLIFHDQEQARYHYREAINRIHDIPVDDAAFIRDRLMDIQLQRDDLLIFDLNNLELKDPEKEMKWHSDSQNVHDSSITDEIKRQYDTIKEQNSEYYLWTLDDIKNYIKHEYSASSAVENSYKEDACKLLDYIQTQHDRNIMKISDTEDNFISQVFTRIYNMNNPTIMENFVMNLKDAYSDGLPVCITGRTSRIISSFAGQDGLGILKSQQVLKHEIYGKAATIRDRLLNAADEEERKKYEAGESTQVENTIKKEIESMVDEYLSVSNKKFVETMKANAVAAV